MSEQVAIQKLMHEELTRIRLRNPQYSLRAFARKLQMPPSAVSEVINGKRRVSRKLAEKIADRLMCAPDVKARLLEGFPPLTPPSRKVAAAGPKGTILRAASVRQPDLIQVSADQFHVVADWYHYGILALAETQDFQSDADWIAKRLGIPKNQVVPALERLERVGMLVRQEGRLRPSGIPHAPTEEIANLSLRRAHAQNLELARQALERDSADRRDFLALTVATDPVVLTQAKQMIRDFRDQLVKLLESGEKKEVYKLCLQFFPVSVAEVGTPGLN